MIMLQRGRNEERSDLQAEYLRLVALQKVEESPEDETNPGVVPEVIAEPVLCEEPVVEPEPVFESPVFQPKPIQLRRFFWPLGFAVSALLLSYSAGVKETFPLPPPKPVHVKVAAPTVLAPIKIVVIQKKDNLKTILSLIHQGKAALKQKDGDKAFRLLSKAKLLVNGLDKKIDEPIHEQLTRLHENARYLKAFAER